MRSASSVPRARYHLLMKPPQGGRPITLSAPMKKAAMVKGIRRPMPAISLIFVFPVATKIAPAQKKRVILPKACMAMWSAPPSSPFGARRTAPRTM